jgi:large subunit ribosomal protein L15
MMIHEITEKVGSHKARKRVGRGRGSGLGKTSGRGHKGAKSRAGYTHRAYFEGGQMNFVRRLPKRGFTNAAFRNLYHIVNVKTLETRFDEGTEINAEVLAAAGVIRDAGRPLKVLGQGELSKKFTVTAAKFSDSARKKIEAAGGTVTETPQRNWTRPKAKPAGGSKDESPSSA